MRKLIVLFLLIACSVNAQLSNYTGKTIQQLSGIESGVTSILSKSYWETYCYAEIKAIIDHLDNSTTITDYSSLCEAFDSLTTGSRLTIPVNTYSTDPETLDCTLTLPSNMILISDNSNLIYTSLSSDTVIAGYGSYVRQANLTANTTIGDSIVYVASTTGFVDGDHVILKATNAIDYAVIKTVTDTSIILHGLLRDSFTTGNNAEIIEYTPKSNIILEGLKVIDDNDNAGLYVKYGKNIIIENCEFDSLNFFKLDSCYNIHIRNCRFTHCDFFKLTACRNIKFINCEFSDGIMGAGEGNIWAVTSPGCYVESCQILGGDSHGIYFDTFSIYSGIINNYIQIEDINNSPVGIFFDHSSNSYSINNTVIVKYGSTGSAIGFSASDYCRIIGNYIASAEDSTKNYGISVIDCDNCIITNNTVREWLDQAAMYLGASSDDCIRNVVANNHFDVANGSVYAMNLSRNTGYTVGYNTITDNIFYSDGVTFGIGIEDSCLENLFKGNRFQGTWSTTYFYNLDSTTISAIEILSDEMTVSTGDTTLFGFVGSDIVIVGFELIWTTAGGAGDTATVNLGSLSTAGSYNYTAYLSGITLTASQTVNTREYYDYNDWQAAAKAVVTRGTQFVLSSTGASGATGKIRMKAYLCDE
jgi:hypothetical protein